MLLLRRRDEPPELEGEAPPDAPEFPEGQA